MINVNNGATPNPNEETLLVQVEFASVPTPLGRLPKGVYYAYKNKWTSIVPLLGTEIKKLINSTFAWGSITGDINAQTDLIAKTNQYKTDFTNSFLFMGA